jgi:hypothetical protein
MALYRGISDCSGRCYSQKGVTSSARGTSIVKKRTNRLQIEWLRQVADVSIFPER